MEGCGSGAGDDMVLILIDVVCLHHTPDTGGGIDAGATAQDGTGVEHRVAAHFHKVAQDGAHLLAAGLDLLLAVLDHHQGLIRLYIGGNGTGSHVGAGSEAGIRQIVRGLNAVLTPETPVCIALETMAGKGSEIGRSFEELAAIYDGVACNNRLRVCFDTCHTSDAGYDVREDFASVIEQFDRIIGKDQIAVFHINDSKNPQGAHKDRHENIGFGEIGYDCLRNIVYNKDFEAIPKILETPYIPNPETKKRAFAPYKYEIAMLREGAFHEDLKEKILEGNK